MPIFRLEVGLPPPELVRCAILSTAGIAVKMLLNGYAEGDIEAVCNQVADIKSNSCSEEELRILQAILALIKAMPSSQVATELEVLKQCLSVYAGEDKLRIAIVSRIIENL